jgi:serine/threonine protein kinase
MAVVGTATDWTCPTCGRANPSEYAVCPHDATPRADQAKTTSDPLIGEVLGRTYRIVRVLGQGGMAKLYEAEHLRIDARYAIKVIHEDLSKDPPARPAGSTRSTWCGSSTCCARAMAGRAW